MKTIKDYEEMGCFNDMQIGKIRVGLEQGLDVSIYAKPEFNSYQMYQIRKGLEAGLDVSIYAKSEFDDDQMSQIRKGLEAGLDVSIYAKPEFDCEQMDIILQGLEKGLDVSIYTKPEFDWRQMHIIRLGLEAGLDVSTYAKPEFNWQQMDIIYERLKNVDKRKTGDEMVENKYTWKDIVKVNGIISTEEFEISGIMDDKNTYQIDDFLDAVAKKYGVGIDDIETYTMDNIEFDPNELSFGAEECGCYINGVAEWLL